MLLSSKALKVGSWLLLSLVAVLTVLNVFTPLRITTDSFRYLNIMEYLEGGLGPESYAAADFYPYGYPRLLQLLHNCHLLNAAILVGINIASVVGASYIFTRLFEVKNKMLFYSFVLLSFVNVKHFTLPVADQLFTLVFFAGIYCTKQGFDRKYFWFIPALVFGIMALYLRTAGVVLFAGAAFYLLHLGYERMATYKYRRQVILVVILSIAGALIAALYFLQHKASYVDQLAISELLVRPLSINARLRYHFQELGEMTINVPVSQLSGRIHWAGIPYVFIAAGTVMFWLILRKVFELKLYSRFPFWVMLAYTMMIFVWPFYDTRFLIPFIPFALYCLFPQFAREERPGYFMTAGSVIYVGLGLLSLAYSAMLSTNKEKFLKYYGNEPKLTRMYQVHFEKKDIGQQASAHSDHDTMSRTLYLLDEYDK